MPRCIERERPVNKHRLWDFAEQFLPESGICSRVNSEHNGLPAEIGEITHEPKSALQATASAQRRKVVRDHQDMLVHPSVCLAWVLHYVMKEPSSIPSFRRRPESSVSDGCYEWESLSPPRQAHDGSPEMANRRSWVTPVKHGERVGLKNRPHVFRQAKALTGIQPLASRKTYVQVRPEVQPPHSGLAGRAPCNATIPQRNTKQIVSRRNSEVPTSDSSLRIWTDSGGCAMRRRTAARPTLRSSATATK
jgi:hypothetical protein